MSESFFVNQHIRELALTHPHEAGWNLYEFPGEAARRLSLHYLLDFIQWRHPECLKKRIAMKCVSEEELQVPPHAEDIEVPYKEVELGRELKSDSWFGEAYIEWVGYRIHFKSFLIKTVGGYTPVYHAATQSNIALCLFTDALERYGQTRQKEADDHITVMNGPDISITPIEWDDILLPHGLLDAIRRNVNSFFESRDSYRDLGIPYRRGFLFVGPPGCGKTVTLKALAYHTRVKAITLLGKANIDDSEIQNTMDLAVQCSPAIVFFEDLDKLLEAKDVSLSHFLNLLDGLNVVKGVLVIATCNEPEKLDPALLFSPQPVRSGLDFLLTRDGAEIGLAEKTRAGAFF